MIERASERLRTIPRTFRSLMPIRAKRRTSAVAALSVASCRTVATRACTQALMDLCAAFDRFGKELRDAKREGRRPHRQFGAPRFKSRRRATPAFALWNDQFAITNHLRFDARPRATMHVPLLGEVRLRAAVPGVGGILGCRVSERRGR